MWLNRYEQATLTVLGVLALVGLGLLAWQRRQPSLTVTGMPLTIQTASWDSMLQHARQIDVNTATAAALERLPEVGPALAQRIVAYREAHGRFRLIDELARVAGIGPKTLQALQDYITVDE